MTGARDTWAIVDRPERVGAGAASGLRGEGDPQGVGAGRSRSFECSLPLKAREFASAVECGKAP